MKYVRLPFFAMGTPCDIQLYGESQLKTRAAARAVIADVERLEQRYSRYRDSSLLSEINRVAISGGTITLDAETSSLLDYAQTCFEQSEGEFDITSGILRQAWDFKSGIIPKPESIEAVLQRVGWEKLEWTRPNLTFPVPGMELDMGGIVKEYAVDRAATICLEKGIQHGLVNLGGDIRIIGPHPDGTPWKVGIRNPGNKDTAVQTLQLSEGALASSGDYERCITIDGKRYGHILHPRTGWPVKHLAAVSVAADLCVLAGSASTIGMLKERDGAQWLGELGLPFLWIDVEGNAGGTLMQN